jgi:hypothetical protein
MEYHYTSENLDISCCSEIELIPPNKEETELIASRISSRNVPKVNSLLAYSDVLHELENRKQKYEDGTIIDLSALEKFAASAEHLTLIIQDFISRFRKLGAIDCSTTLNKIRTYMLKIDKFATTSETLATMMNLSNQESWYYNYTATLKNLDDSINIATSTAHDVINSSHIHLSQLINERKYYYHFNAKSTLSIDKRYNRYNR